MQESCSRRGGEGWRAQSLSQLSTPPLIAGYLEGNNKTRPTGNPVHHPSAFLATLRAPVLHQTPWCLHKDLHTSCGATAEQPPVTSHRATGDSPPPALPRWNRRTQSRRLGNMSRWSDEDVTSHPSRRRQLLPPRLVTPLLAAPRTAASQSPVSSQHSSELSLKMSVPPLPHTAPLPPPPRTPVASLFPR